MLPRIIFTLKLSNNKGAFCIAQIYLYCRPGEKLLNIFSSQERPSHTAFTLSLLADYSNSGNVFDVVDVVIVDLLTRPQIQTYLVQCGLLQSRSMKGCYFAYHLSYDGPFSVLQLLYHCLQIICLH